MLRQWLLTGNPIPSKSKPNQDQEREIKSSISHEDVPPIEIKSDDVPSPSKIVADSATTKTQLKEPKLPPSTHQKEQLLSQSRKKNVIIDDEEEEEQVSSTASTSTTISTTTISTTTISTTTIENDPIFSTKPKEDDHPKKSITSQAGNHPPEQKTTPPVDSTIISKSPDQNDEIETDPLASDSSEADEEEELNNCSVCDDPKDDDKLLLCDGCDAACHTYCDQPALESVPEGEWYCQQCRISPNDSSQPKPPPKRASKRKTRPVESSDEDEYVPSASSDEDDLPLIDAISSDSAASEDDEIVVPAKSKRSQPKRPRTLAKTSAASTSSVTSDSPRQFDSFVSKFQFGSKASPATPTPVTPLTDDDTSRSRSHSTTQLGTRSGSGLNRLDSFSFDPSSVDFTNLQAAVQSRESIASKFS